MDIDFIKDIIKNSPTYTGQKIAIYRGALRPKILIVGEYSTFEDISVTKPISGAKGRLLDTMLDELKLSGQTGITNVIPYPIINTVGSTKHPSTMDISYFRPYIKKLISRILPELVICMGNIATKAVIGYGEDACLTKFFVKNSRFYVGLRSIGYYQHNDSDFKLDFNNIYKNYFIDVE